MRIRIDKADTVFSKFIRTRDGWKCRRCGRIDPPPHSTLQCSHYFGRGKESTRFDEDNCVCLCFGCHQEWGSNDRESYRSYMIKWLGESRFDALTVRANTPQKKDRQLAYIYYKERLKLLQEGI